MATEPFDIEAILEEIDDTTAPYDAAAFLLMVRSAAYAARLEQP